ncbi:hypothetical protein BG60_11915 [Caballeronia zhejiangensis]|uniref:Uncharacterized protein n=1 Tax=Caballeronia zhejiangensis TaxID=871203 RepID=A0A656QED6_9BURK|nr:hypothetical protein BG60_11915 [Caballeronia zhejiangensis]
MDIDAMIHVRHDARIIVLVRRAQCVECTGIADIVGVAHKLIELRLRQFSLCDGSTYLGFCSADSRSQLRIDLSWRNRAAQFFGRA